MAGLLPLPGRPPCHRPAAFRGAPAAARDRVRERPDRLRCHVRAAQARPQRSRPGGGDRLRRHSAGPPPTHQPHHPPPPRPPPPPAPQPIKQMGTTAFDVLYSMLNREHLPARDIVLPTELIRRESCGCPAPADRADIGWARGGGGSGRIP